MFYDTLVKLISSKGISNIKFINDVGLAKGSLTNWKERGTTPNGETLKKIADYFDVTVDYLLGGDLTPSVKNQLGDEQYALWGEIHELTEAEAEDVLNFIKFKKAQREIK